MRAALCLLTVIGIIGCDFGEKKELRPRSNPTPADASPDAGVPAADPSVTQQAFFNICPDTRGWRRCNTLGQTDTWAGWWNDSPGYGEVQMWAPTGTCWIVNCNEWQQEVGIYAGGTGDLRRWLPHGFQQARVGVGTYAEWSEKTCWDGGTVPIYGWWSGWWQSGPVRSFGCFPL